MIHSFIDRSAFRKALFMHEVQPKIGHSCIYIYNSKPFTGSKKHLMNNNKSPIPISLSFLMNIRLKVVDF